MIYDQENKPVHNAAIYVIKKYMVSSDIQGHFAIPQIKPKLSYTILAQKTNYEDIQMDIAYNDPSYVLYIRMASGDQLLGEAEQAIRAKNWAQAGTFLDRAQQAGADAAPAQYLRAILAFYQEQYTAALGFLAALAEQEKNAPYLYLFIADIYQYHLKENDRAEAYLKRFLELRYDPEVRKRLEDLSGTDPQ
jgi:tetratricopeptide (TPR) repeat protein